MRALFFAYGSVCYLVFFGTFLYLVGFLGNLVVPKSIDSGAEGPLLTALLVDSLLLALFAVPHSVMARPAFKRWWTRFVAEPIERSVYVLVSSLLVILLYWQWQPIGQEVWNVEAPAAVITLQGLFFAGFAVVLYATFLIDHFDLFGMRQVYLHLRGRPYTHHPFDTPSMYRYVRHPLYVGWIMTFWFTPTMTLGHLLFAALATGYIFVAIYFEERNLVEHFGETYVTYQKTTWMIFPGPRGRGRA